jgi:hypothetical protein
MYSEIIEHLFGTRVQSAMESGGLFEEGGAENVENWVVYKVRTVVEFFCSEVIFRRFFSHYRSYLNIFFCGLTLLHGVVH